MTFIVESHVAMLVVWVVVNWERVQKKNDPQLDVVINASRCNKAKTKRSRGTSMLD